MLTVTISCHLMEFFSRRWWESGALARSTVTSLSLWMWWCVLPASSISVPSALIGEFTGCLSSLSCFLHGFFNGSLYLLNNRSNLLPLNCSTVEALHEACTHKPWTHPFSAWLATFSVFSLFPSICFLTLILYNNPFFLKISCCVWNPEWWIFSS